MAQRDQKIMVVLCFGAATIGLAGFAAFHLRSKSGPARPQATIAASKPAFRDAQTSNASRQTPSAGASLENTSSINLRHGDFDFGDDARRGEATGIASIEALKPAFERLQSGDYEQALWLAEPIAKSGDPTAQHLVGYLYEKGLGGRKDLQLARRFYRRAADAGNLDGQVALGELLIREASNEVDRVQAVRWFRRAAEAGDSRALARLGALYADGIGVTQDRVVAESLFEKAAEKGDPDALFLIAMAALDGKGQPQNPAKAADLLAKAVAGGHAEAAYNLALIYRTDLLGASDKEGAAQLMQAAAEAGYAPAMTAMGLYAHNGEADGRAADWFERAARGGDLQGSFLYAVSLAEGDGRPKDPEEARRLAREVAGNPAAPSELAENARKLIASLGPDVGVDPNSGGGTDANGLRE